MKSILQKIHAGETLLKAEATAALDMVLEGSASTEQVGAFLMALSMRGETAAELSGFLASIRKRVISVGIRSSDVILDNCGTGGGGPSTFNISTAAALILAAGGVKVAKHGNRSATGRCGSADVAEALNIPLLNSPVRAAESLDERGFSFLFAPHFHPGLAKLAPMRRAIGVRTCFNLLGPLANPAAVSRQIIGVCSQQHLDLFAEVLRTSDIERAYVVCGYDHMDEFSLCAPTNVRLIQNGEIITTVVTPEDFGMSYCHVRALAGGDAATNADIITHILAGRDETARRDIVVMNAAAGFVLAGLETNFRSGVTRALDVIASQSALNLVTQLKEVSL